MFGKRAASFHPSIQGTLRKSIFLGSSLFLGVGAGLFGFASSAAAIETIIFRYNATEVTITLDELERFSAGADIQKLTELLQDRATETQNVAGSTVQLVRDALVQQIRISDSFRADVTNFLEGSTGEFLLMQLERVLSGATPGARGDLDDLRKSVEASIDDDGYISALEVATRYPQNTVRINASGLTGTVNDVALFLEKIEPVLQSLRGVLEDLICDCEKTEANGVPADARAANCQAPESLVRESSDPQVHEQPQASADPEIEAEVQNLSLKQGANAPAQP
jgi:Alpha/beta hydrolase of unknown function (DUF1400)